MEPTGPAGTGALRARIAELLVDVAHVQRGYADAELTRVRDAAIRIAIIADDMVGLIDTYQARAEEARWNAAVDRAIRAHKNGK